MLASEPLAAAMRNCSSVAELRSFFTRSYSVAFNGPWPFYSERTCRNCVHSVAHFVFAEFVIVFNLAERTCRNFVPGDNSVVHVLKIIDRMVIISCMQYHLSVWLCGCYK